MNATAALDAAVPETSAPPSMADLYIAARACLHPWWRRLCGRDWDAEDILHDTVLVAHRRIHRFVPAPRLSRERALAAWLVGIAWRIAHRRRQRCDEAWMMPANDGEIPDAAPDPEALAFHAERRKLLDGIFRGLQPERAEAVILHVCAELPTPAIAEVLGVNQNTVKSRIHRGSRDLRAAMERSRLGELGHGLR